MTTTYPIKPPLYAVTKSTNYLPNVLIQMEAQEAGLDNGVFIDAAGNVGESSNMNVAFVMADGVLRHPKFDHILSGCTSLRLLDLAHRLEGGLLRGVEVCDIPVAEARARPRDAADRQLGQGGPHRGVGPASPSATASRAPSPPRCASCSREDMRAARDRLIDIPY